MGGAGACRAWEIRRGLYCPYNQDAEDSKGLWLLHLHGPTSRCVVKILRRIRCSPVDALCLWPGSKGVPGNTSCNGPKHLGRPRQISQDDMEHELPKAGL